MYTVSFFGLTEHGLVSNSFLKIIIFMIVNSEQKQYTLRQNEQIKKNIFYGSLSDLVKNNDLR